MVVIQVYCNSIFLTNIINISYFLCILDLHSRQLLLCSLQGKSLDKFTQIEHKDRHIMYKFDYLSQLRIHIQHKILSQHIMNNILVAHKAYHLDKLTHKIFYKYMKKINRVDTDFINIFCMDKCTSSKIWWQNWQKNLWGIETDMFHYIYTVHLDRKCMH